MSTEIAKPIPYDEGLPLVKDMVHLSDGYVNPSVIAMVMTNEGPVYGRCGNVSHHVEFVVAAIHQVIDQMEENEIKKGHPLYGQWYDLKGALCEASNEISAYHKDVRAILDQGDNQN